MIESDVSPGESGVQLTTVKRPCTLMPEQGILIVVTREF